MDLVTSNLVQSFKADEGFDNSTPADVLFEHFANFCVLSHEYTDEFDLEDIHTGGGDDLGIDGIAVIVNGALISSPEEIDDLADSNKFVKAEFILVQAKSQSNFDGKDISNLFFGAKDLFAGTTAILPRNDQVKSIERLISKVYSKSALFKRGNPTLKLYFVTIGKWMDDAKLNARIGTETQSLVDLNIFSEVELVPIDAIRLQKLFNKAKNRISKSITFSGRVTLPTLPGVTEAFLGFIPVTEFLKLITDDSGSIVKGLFYDNVRDFQGDNPVNQEMEKTLLTDDRQLFVLLNNGVTIVCGTQIQKTGDIFTIEDYQIVNGCQTSHVIYNNQTQLTQKDFQIPIKLIALNDENVKNKVIKATNRQTEVKDEELAALTDFQKRLEEYYQAISNDLHRLYYERRSQQYRADSKVERIRIVNIATQIRAFASMFLSQAHIASRYYGNLLKTVEQNIFVATHSPAAYYLSALALFRLEALIRKKVIEQKYRPFKYHIVFALRLCLEDAPMPDIGTNKFEKYCNVLIQKLQNDAHCTAAIIECCKVLDSVIGNDISNRDAAKDASISSKLQAVFASKSTS
jgi:AIPR protein